MYQINFNQPIHIHFMGIGGISMSGLAQILLEAGFTVSGSDSKKSPLTEQLTHMGASIKYPQMASNITKDIDLVVYTAAISGDNPEFVEAKNQNLPMITRAELLGQIMKNYKMLIEYDGTRYKGWESHKAGDMTIQGKLVNVIEHLAGAPVEVIGCGRTDAGVHAKGMVANAKLDANMTPEEMKCYLNHYLPEDIAVLEVGVASERFHSRYNAVGKTYCYTCYIGSTKPVFDRKYVDFLGY